MAQDLVGHGNATVHLDVLKDISGVLKPVRVQAAWQCQ